MSRMLTVEEIIEKFNKVHYNRYDYSLVVYLGYYYKVSIICPIHGVFLQDPGNHLAGKGCPKCGVKNRTNKTRFTLEEFIEKARAIHGYKYSYEKVIYIDSQTLITITCPIHGDFNQKPNNHLMGKGCPGCMRQKLKETNTYTKEEFIRKAIEIHGGRYDYSLVNYISCFNKVIIICREHGEFEQTPSSHLSGYGCPGCTRSKGEHLISLMLEKNNIDFVQQYKISGTTYRFRYDFYLPDYNLLIEFHGLQHYKPVKFFGGEEKFKTLQFNDNFKKHLAKLAGIDIIYFNYKHLEKSIEEFEIILLSELRKKQNKIACRTL